MSNHRAVIRWQRTSAEFLNPNITWSGEKLPAPEDQRRLRHRAHEQCFIANPIKTEVIVSALD